MQKSSFFLRIFLKDFFLHISLYTFFLQIIQDLFLHIFFKRYVKKTSVFLLLVKESVHCEPEYLYYVAFEFQIDITSLKLNTSY